MEYYTAVKNDDIKCAYAIGEYEKSYAEWISIGVGKTQNEHIHLGDLKWQHGDTIQRK